MNGNFLPWVRRPTYRNFKPLREVQPARNGLACATMLLNYFGKDVGYEALLAECATRQQTGNLRDLVSIFGQYGLSPRALGGTANDVPRLKLPCLILWNKHHFVVLTDIIGGQYYIYDPAASARIIKLDPVVFECYFAEIAVELYYPDEPRQELPDVIKTTPPKNLTALPHISVVIPTFNRPAELTRALQSVFNQDYSNLQVIVINDGSQSQYDTILADYGAKITYLQHPISLGVSGARNTGIQAATGEWVLFLDDDDELANNYINALSLAIRDNTNIAFFWSNVKEAHYVNNQLMGYRLRRYSVKAKGTSLMCAAATIGASYGFAVKRQVLLNVGLFNPNYSVGEDTDLIYKLLSHGHQPQPLDVIGAIKHQHNQDRLTLNFDAYSATNIFEKIAASYANFLQQHTRLYFNLLFWTARVHYSAQNFDAGDSATNRLLAFWWKRPLPTWLGYRQLVRIKREACAAVAVGGDEV